MGDDAPPASPTVSFGAEVTTSDGSEAVAVDNTSNPLELTVADGVERTASEDAREAAIQASLRSSILKPGEGPVVSPRNRMTRNLSFVDQTQDARPLKEVRLYERDPKPGQPGRPGSLLGPPEEEEEESAAPLMIAVGVAILLVRARTQPFGTALLPLCPPTVYLPVAEH
jgi:hypothetical protein